MQCEHVARLSEERGTLYCVRFGAGREVLSHGVNDVTSPGECLPLHGDGEVKGVVVSVKLTLAKCQRRTCRAFLTA